MDRFSNVTELKGVGEKKAALLSKLNIFTIGDLIEYYPRTYQDRSNIKRIRELKDGEEALICGRVIRVLLTGNPYRKPVLHVLCDDGSGTNIEIIFFNGKWLQRSFTIGEEYSFFGKASVDYGKIKMIHPDFSKGDTGETEQILPIYPLTEGLRQSDLRKWIRQCISVIDENEEYLPSHIVKNYKLCPHGYAQKYIHFPGDKEHYKYAKYRLVFDELLLLQLELMYIRMHNAGAKGISFMRSVDINDFLKTLSYELTGAQNRVLSEIEADMESEHIMNRLVQGDVGSGKTAVAEAAIFKAVKSGYQAAMMAPTEILAHQHFDEFKRVFEPLGIRTGFLSGSLSTKDKNEIYSKIEKGEVDVIVGTHALIQRDVCFNKLGLVITDEQHRFGVNQRKTLSEKGENPDILVMSATPIPRTLAVILYGDLDISVIDEMPPGRQTIKTGSVSEGRRIKTYEFMHKEILSGRQAYIVAPLIEDSESIEGVRSAQSIYDEVREAYPDIKTALLHGEMKQAEKDAIMMDFVNGDIDVLVSTVVIEVGINVPNATMMIIENCERFGLAQLHQLRGRVGRGNYQSYCVLVLGKEGEIAKERANIMCESSDGFYIAEKDLELRGPGELFGTRQHGLPEFKLANLAKHTKILATSQQAAKELAAGDIDLLRKLYPKLDSIPI